MYPYQFFYINCARRPKAISVFFSCLCFILARAGFARIVYVAVWTPYIDVSYLCIVCSHNCALVVDVSTARVQQIN